MLTDNGKQFTGRFTQPRPTEVLFERICRDNGIAAIADQATHPDHDGQGGAISPDSATRMPRRRACSPPSRKRKRRWTHS